MPQKSDQSDQSDQRAVVNVITAVITGEIRRSVYLKKLGTEERMSKDSLDSNLGRKVGKYIDRYTDVLPLHAFPLKK